MTEEAKPQRVTPDWERIEGHYRAGLLSLREIAGKEGISHVSIAKRAKRDGWTKNLAAKIQAKADALVNRETVNRQGNSEAAVNEKAIVDAGAQAVAEIRLSHRTDIARLKGLISLMLDELETVSSNLPAVKQLREALASDRLNPGDPKMAALAKMITLPSRSGIARTLIDSFRSLVALEREAWGLEKGTGDGGGPQSIPEGLISFDDGGPGQAPPGAAPVADTTDGDDSEG